MKRPLRPEELRLWGVVAGTVHPLPGRATPKAPAVVLPSPSWGGTAERGAAGVGQNGPKAPRVGSGPHVPTRPAHRSGRPAHEGAGKVIEPRRRHRIAVERDPIGARLDLHGLDQDRARSLLEAFLRRAWDDGYRAVLVITGKGVQGDGVLRRRTPEWLAAPYLAPIVAGVSEAHRRHGGDGALYVALKRKPKV